MSDGQCRRSKPCRKNPRKTTRREDIHNETSFRRNLFILADQKCLAWYEMPRQLEFVPKQFKDD